MCDCYILSNTTKPDRRRNRVRTKQEHMVVLTWMSTWNRFSDRSEEVACTPFRQMFHVSQKKIEEVPQDESTSLLGIASRLYSNTTFRHDRQLNATS